MLLLRRCCASPREKKKKSASSTHISKEILENLWELRRKQQELFRIMGKRVRLTDSEHNSTGPAEPAIQLPAARRGVSPPPHSPSSQEKAVFCQVRALNQPSSRSAKMGRSLTGISATLLGYSQDQLPKLNKQHKNSTTQQKHPVHWKIEPKEISHWIQGTRFTVNSVTIRFYLGQILHHLSIKTRAL